jgi:hypothetical protein
MRTMKTIVASITAVLMATSAFGQLEKDAAPAAAQIDLTGDWDMTIQSPQGTNTVKVTLTQDGEKVSGLFKSPLGELPVTGALTGDDLTIAFTLPIQGQSIDIVMTGKVEGPTLAGKAQFGGFGEGDWTATRAEAAEAAAKPAGAPGGASGEWDLTFKTPKGDVPATATINQDGGKLSGTLSSHLGEGSVTGTLEGTSLRVTSNVITPRGTLPIKMKGNIEGNAITNGKAKVKGIGTLKWTAKRRQ